jgi:hypothetical protein
MLLDRLVCSAIVSKEAFGKWCYHTKMRNLEDVVPWSMLPTKLSATDPMAGLEKEVSRIAGRYKMQ